VSFSTVLSCAELAAHLNDPQWRIFDCRHQLSDVGFGEKAYAEGHLPGAFFLHLDRDLSSAMTGRNGRHPLPDARLLAAKLGAAGVARQTQVVVYDDAGGMVAARLWWLLRWLGHERVALLDGGFNQWVKEGRPLSTARPESAPAVFAVAERDWLVSSAELLANIERGELCVVDARAPDRFRGENETIDPVGGHIPGARNRFFRDNVDADGFFRPAAELRREFLALLAGVDPAQAVMQCGSGVSACHNLLAMEIAGLHGARLYAGSWSEWCADPARPVAR
jgi:thiosulfate/3-mercaptopyruvate sulfurtransferase